MLVGILSDTHGRADAAAAAVKLLLDRGAALLLHCGDVGSTEVLDALAGHRATFVFGNNDWDTRGLERYADSLGITCGGAAIQLTLPGEKKALLTHGDDLELIQRTLAEQAVDYLFMGHTHRRQDMRRGRVRVINPGALFRAAEKTVALLDPQSDQLEFLPVST